jgi:hypothetical protein
LTDVNEEIKEVSEDEETKEVSAKKQIKRTFSKLKNVFSYLN